MLNPFEILNLEQSYSLDLSMLERHYFEAQRKTHPDQFSCADSAEKAETLKHSTLVNQAYKTLKNPLLRAEYLLKTAGVEPLSENPDFLGQVMEWNERFVQGEYLKPELEQKEKFLFDELEKAFHLKDNEAARRALYQLTYVQKLLKQCENG
jgi:molecular chaperone HscB